jgi:hypothetical protein
LLRLQNSRNFALLNNTQKKQTKKMGNQLVQIVKDSGLEQSKSQVLLANFQNYFEIAAEWENKAKMLSVTDESQKAEMKMAREGRLFLKEKRIAVERTRKELKEQSLREGQTIDAIAKILKNLIEPIENYLEQQEKFVEIKEAAIKAERERERIKILTALQFDFTFVDVLNMPDMQFDELVLKIKNERDAKIAAEKKAEEERIARIEAERIENERIRIENERIRAENERLRQEAEAKEKQARIEAERNAKIEAELRAKAEAELRAQKEKERIEKERIEKEKKAKNAPDKEKLIDFAKLIDALQRPEIKTDEAAKIMNDANTLLSKVSNFIREKSATL